MYRLTVEKFVEQKPISKEEVEALKRNPSPLSSILGQSLQGGFKQFMTIELTDEEFSAVKKAVLGVM